MLLLPRKDCMAYVYELFHPSIPEVDCSNLVWSSYHVPKTSFISWLVCCERLQTKEVLSRFIQDIDCRCTLCNDADETIAHLFFECRFSTPVVHTIMGKMGLEVECTTLQG